jgi:hypothetical protein
LQVKAKDQHSVSVEKAKAKARRLLAIENQRTLKEQMAEKLERDALDDIKISDKERQFMKPLLDQAKCTVVAPRPIAINFA